MIPEKGMVSCFGVRYSAKLVEEITKTQRLTPKTFGVREIDKKDIRCRRVGVYQNPFRILNDTPHERKMKH